MAYQQNLFYEGPDYKTEDGVFAIDTEFSKEGPISLQVSYYKFPDVTITYIVINNKYKHLVPPIKRDYYVVFSDFKSDQNVLIDSFIEVLMHYDCYEKVFYKEKLSFILYVYFSAKDLTYAFGLENKQEYYIGKNPRRKLIQRRSLTGNLFFRYFDQVNANIVSVSFIIKDLFGLSSGGLSELAKTVNLEKSTKMDGFKLNMVEGLEKDPEAFLFYAINDCILLPKIHKLLIGNYNEILRSKNITDFFTEYNMPLTVGSIVSKIWEKNLIQ